MANSRMMDFFQSIFGQDFNALKISYSSKGRFSHVHYQYMEGSFVRYSEFSGGDCKATIDIPTKED